MHISLIQYGQIAWRVSVAAVPPGAERPLWTQDNFPSAEAALEEAQTVLAYFADLEPAA